MAVLEDCIVFPRFRSSSQSLVTSSIYPRRPLSIPKPSSLLYSNLIIGSGLHTGQIHSSNWGRAAQYCPCYEKSDRRAVPPHNMGLVQNLYRRIPSSQASLEKLDALSRRAEKVHPRLAFFRRRIRLKGNSSISIPLGIVLLFPCIVIIVILILFVRHPDSGGIMMMPNGTPTSIRCVPAVTPKH